ncbi:MAG: dihydroorotate dehydrogenase [Treponema sp.]|jgi:dihydroorotate dehydrogenase (NAD+) catalytic subunit|nr:dihydroorotate dehydrogenase [Treponema sp.]
MLETVIAGVRFKNPVIAASGTFGYGREYAELVDVSALGGICSKGLTLRPRAGNSGTRLYETPSGLLNSIGLENPGIPAFIEKELPSMKQLGTVVIANLSGSDIDEYIEGAKLLDAADVDMVELNISCPNVREGGMAFGLEPETAASVCRAVRRVLHKPLVVKLSPNAPSITAVARACVDHGADALSLVNTFKAMAIDVETRLPVFDNAIAGLSGPAIRPIALRMVWELAETASVPIIGMGGIACAEDALQFLMAGADAVQVGTNTFVHPRSITDVIDGVAAYMKKHSVKSVGELKIRRRARGEGHS